MIPKAAGRNLVSLVLNWVSAVTASLEKEVRKHFPEELYRWPILRAFDWEAHSWRTNYLVLVFRNRLSGIPAGNIGLLELPPNEGPDEVPSAASIIDWQKFLRTRFELTPEDMVLILPRPEEGKTVEEVASSWSSEQKQMWQAQFQMILNAQYSHLRGLVRRSEGKPDIFLSYAREDERTAERFATKLESHGWSIFWDLVIRSGQHFDRVIEEALSEALCVVVLWSQSSVGSDWVRAEATRGLERDILISVSIEEVELPVRFSNVHTTPVCNWNSDDSPSGLGRVIQDIESLLGSPTGLD